MGLLCLRVFGVLCACVFACAKVSAGVAGFERSPPTLLVIYKNDSGTVSTQADGTGQLLLDVLSPDLPVGRVRVHNELAKRTTVEGLPVLEQQLDRHRISIRLDRVDNGELVLDWTTKQAEPERSHREHVGRILLPFAAAALAFNGISDPDLNFMGDDLRTIFGHYMVIATVSNLADYMDGSLAELLEEHHLGGVIPPKWAAKGAVALLMLGTGQLESVGEKTKLSVGKSLRLFSQSQYIGRSALMLGEVSGQVLDRVINLSPDTRALLTSIFGGAATASSYYLLTELLGGRDFSRDLHGKITGSATVGAIRAAAPFLEDFVALGTDNPALKNIGTHALFEVVSLAVAGGLYALVNRYPFSQSNGIYISRLVAGSFMRLAGSSLAEMVGSRTIDLLTEERKDWTATATKVISYLSLSLAANQAYSAYGLAAENHSPILKDALHRLRDGIFATTITTGVTTLMTDMIRAAEPPQPITLNITLKGRRPKVSAAEEDDPNNGRPHQRMGAG